MSRIRLWIDRMLLELELDWPYCGPYIRDSSACTRSSKGSADDAGIAIVMLVVSGRCDAL
jgi:hypothetical protein